MIGLLYKDFVCARIGRLLAVLFGGAVCIMGLIAVLFPNPEEAGALLFLFLFTYMLICIFLIPAAVTVSVTATDDGKSVEAYIRSLPTGKKRYVLEKYLAVFLVCVFFLAFFEAVFFICRGFLEEAGLLALVNPVQGLLPVLIGIALFIAALEMPFYIRFGTRTGENVRSTIVVLVFFACLVYLMFGDLQIFRHITLEGAVDFLERHPQILREYKLWIPAGSVICYGVSAALSLWLYPQKGIGED